MGRPLVCLSRNLEREHPSRCSCASCAQSPSSQNQASSSASGSTNTSTASWPGNPGESLTGSSSLLTASSSTSSSQDNTTVAENQIDPDTPRPPSRSLQTSIEHTADSLRRVTSAIESVYRNLAIVRDNIRRNMDMDMNTDPSSNRMSALTTASSAFNSDMAPSHSAIILADGTEVIAPVHASSSSSQARAISHLINSPANNGTSGVSQSSSTLQNPSSSTGDTDTGMGATSGDPISYNEYMRRYTTEYLTRQARFGNNRLPSDFYGVSDDLNMDPNALAPSSATVGGPTNAEDRQIRSTAEAIQSLTMFLEEIRSSMASAGIETNPTAESNRQRSGRTSDFSSMLFPSDSRGPSDRDRATPQSPAPAPARPLPNTSSGGAAVSATDLFNFFRSRADAASANRDDPSTTLGRRVEARAAAMASIAAREATTPTYRRQTNARRNREVEAESVFERATLLADRLETHLDRLARHRTDLLEASHTLRRGPSTSPSNATSNAAPSGRLSASDSSRWTNGPSRPTNRLVTIADNVVPQQPVTRGGRARTVRDEVYQTPPQRMPGRTSHIDRNGRLSYNPTLPSGHPLAFIHRHPAAPVPGLTSHDFHSTEQATGRRRRYTVISPVRDGADGVHTVTMSDSSSDDEFGDILRNVRQRHSLRSATTARTNTVRPRTVSQGSGRALSGQADRHISPPRPFRIRRRDLRNQRSVSRERIPSLSSVTDDDSREDTPLFSGSRLNASRPTEREGGATNSGGWNDYMRARAQAFTPRNESIEDLIEAMRTPSPWSQATSQSGARLQANTLPMFSVGPDDSGSTRARVNLNGSASSFDRHRASAVSASPEDAPTEIADSDGRCEFDGRGKVFGSAEPFVPSIGPLPRVKVEFGKSKRGVVQAPPPKPIVVSAKPRCAGI